MKRSTLLENQPKVNGAHAMKPGKLLVIGLWSCLLAIPVIADDSGNTAFDNPVGAAAGNQTREDAGTMSNGADDGVPKAGTAKRKAAPKRKSAGTGTLLRYIYDQDKKGNIKIEGMTDTAPPP